jgi:hypothetical protein
VAGGLLVSAPAQAATAGCTGATAEAPHLMGGDTVYGSAVLSGCHGNPKVVVGLARDRWWGVEPVSHNVYTGTNGRKGAAYGCDGDGTFTYWTVVTVEGLPHHAKSSAKRRITC